jgi:hypothetical protein
MSDALAKPTVPIVSNCFVSLGLVSTLAGANTALGDLGHNTAPPVL